ncbi:MAG: autotransporter outer membrane beta-barrel domain-containing protein [Planctomycetia bacterium]|nr:autotransporter outer membrane beta-barrel domain-containing protein [Planctomycetia bacterium]
MISNIAKNATNATANIWYATKDEKGNVTAIQWDATRENIEKVIDDGYASSTTLTGTGDMYVRTYGATNDGTAYGLSHYNGNTFVFDNNDTTNWEGETGTQEGTIALTAGTVLGKNGGLSAVSISGEEYSLLDNDTYEVTQAGMLAFYRGDDTTSEAATINAFSIQFYDGCNYRSTKDNRIVKNDVVNGARIWFDAGQANNGCTTLANINATNIEFGSMTQVWYDRVSEVDSGTALTINLNKNARIATVTYDYENSGTPTDPTTFKTWEKNARTATIITDKATYLSELFGKAQLVKAEYDETTGAIKVNSVDAAKFAADNGMTEKEQEYAAQLDTNRTNANVNGIGGLDSKTTQDFYDALYNEEDAGKVKNTISNLSRGSGIENVPTMTQHLGSIGSPFSAGLGVGGVSTRGQEENMPVTAQGTPADSTSSSAMAYDNYDSGRTWTPWVSYSYSEIEGDEHTRDGVKYDSYKVQRSGVLAGFRSRLSDSLSAGILFAYSGPEMNQSGRFEGYDTIGQGGYASNIDMEDFQFALHFEKLLGWRQDWEFNAFIGGGAQSLDWQRTVYFNNIGHQFTGETTGNTFTATFYLAKRLQLSDRLVLRPTVGFDSEHNWMYGFDEQGNAIDNPDMMMAVHSQAFHYDRIEYSRNTIRVGMSAAFTPCHKQGGLSARIFYGHQLDEDDAATVHMTNNMGDWMVQGAAMGRDSWTLGAGGYWYFDDAQTLSISADYNAVLYDNASTQNVTATLTKRF